MAFFDNYFICLEIYLVSPLLNRVSSVFFPFSSDIFYIFPCNLPGKIKSISSNCSIHTHSSHQPLSSRSLQSENALMVYKTCNACIQLKQSGTTQNQRKIAHTRGARAPSNAVVSHCPSSTPIPDQCPNDQYPTNLPAQYLNAPSPIRA